MRGDFHSHIAEMPSNKGERAPQRHRRRRAAGHGWSSLSTTPTCTTRPPAKPPVIYDLRPQISLIAADARPDIPLALFHVVVRACDFLYRFVRFRLFCVFHSPTYAVAPAAADAKPYIHQIWC